MYWYQGRRFWEICTDSGSPGRHIYSGPPASSVCSTRSLSARIPLGRDPSVSTHNINKTFYKIIVYNKENDAPSRLEQERFTKMNRKSTNTCLTDMINIQYL